MSNGLVVSPVNAITKTRNAILRIKKSSPELRTVLRQRCQERINNDRLKILCTLRKIKIQDSFRTAFGNILCEEWKNIENDELCEPLPDASEEKTVLSGEFNIDEELELEDFLKKELLAEHEDWLLQLYEELFSENLENVNDVVCPLCCSGFLTIKDFKTTVCTKCSSNFTIEKSLQDLQTAIYQNLSLHEKQCDNNPSFVNVPKNENENNLCLACYKCSYLNVIT